MMSLSCFCHLVPEGKRCLNCFVNWLNAGAIRKPAPRVLPPPKASCSVPSCERIAVVKTLCYSHYDAARARAVRDAIRVG